MYVLQDTKGRRLCWDTGYFPEFPEGEPGHKAILFSREGQALRRINLSSLAGWCWLYDDPAFLVVHIWLESGPVTYVYYIPEGEGRLEQWERFDADTSVEAVARDLLPTWLTEYILDTHFAGDHYLPKEEETAC